MQWNAISLREAEYCWIDCLVVFNKGREVWDMEHDFGKRDSTEFLLENSNENGEPNCGMWDDILMILRQKKFLIAWG